MKFERDSECRVWGCAIAGKADDNAKAIASSKAMQRPETSRSRSWKQMPEITRLNSDYILTTYMGLCNFVSTKSF